MNKFMMKPMAIALGMFLAACGSVFSDKERIENWVYDRATQDNLQYISVDPAVSFQGVQYEPIGFYSYGESIENARLAIFSVFNRPTTTISLVSIETTIEGRRFIQTGGFERCRIRRITTDEYIASSENLYKIEGTFVLPIEIHLNECLQHVQNGAVYTLHFRTNWAYGSEFRVTKRLMLQ